MNSEFGSLKPDSVIDIFNAAVSASKLTRAELAERCGLSVMTVGKAADALVSLRVLRQGLSGSSSSGRRSRVLSVSPDWWFAVYTVGERCFTFYMLDLSLRVIDELTYTLRDSIFIDDEFRHFSSRAVAFANARRKSERCCGSAILLPSDHDASALLSPSMSKSPMRSGALDPAVLLSGDASFGKMPVCGNVKEYHARRVSACSGGENVICVYINAGDVKTVYSRSDFSKGVPFTNSGLYVGKNSNKSLNEMTLVASDPEVLCKTLAEYLSICILCVPCDMIYISGDHVRHIEAVRDVTAAAFAEQCMGYGIIPPPIQCGSIRLGAATAIAKEMRDKWFSEEILGNTY